MGVFYQGFWGQLLSWFEARVSDGLNQLSLLVNFADQN